MSEGSSGHGKSCTRRSDGRATCSQRDRARVDRASSRTENRSRCTQSTTLEVARVAPAATGAAIATRSATIGTPRASIGTTCVETSLLVGHSALRAVPGAGVWLSVRQDHPPAPSQRHRPHALRRHARDGGVPSEPPRPRVDRHSTWPPRRWRHRAAVPEGAREAEPPLHHARRPRQGHSRRPRDRRRHSRAHGRHESPRNPRYPAIAPRPRPHEAGGSGGSMRRTDERSKARSRLDQPGIPP